MNIEYQKQKKFKVIIPIMLKTGIYWDNFFNRLFQSIDSIEKTSDIEICIFDASETSNSKLFSKYNYENKYLGPEFRRAVVLNCALSTFDSEYYIISDHDIIYRDNFLNNKINLILEKKLDLYIPKVKKFNEDGSLDLKLLGSPGNIIISKSLFIKLHGYNEKYYISGCEDVDFIERAKWFDKHKNYYVDQDYLLSLWHPQWYDKVKYYVNKFIYRHFYTEYITKGNFDWRTYETPDYRNILEKKLRENTNI